MRSVGDEIMGVAIKRARAAEDRRRSVAGRDIEKQARSIKYQLTVAKLPLASDIDDFDFTGTPVNESPIRDLAGGAFAADQRTVVLVGGTGTGKSHLAIAIARLIRNGARGRFFNVVDLVNRLETEARAGRQGRIADHLTWLDFVVLDELGYLLCPGRRTVALPPRIQALRAHQRHHHQPGVWRVAYCSAMPR